MYKIVIPCTPISRTEVDLNVLAGWLASQSSEIQAQFFNEFIIQLIRICDIYTNSNSLGHNMQLHWIREELSQDAIFYLTQLGEEYSV